MGLKYRRIIVLNLLDALKQSFKICSPINFVLPYGDFGSLVALSSLIGETFTSPYTVDEEL